MKKRLTLKWSAVVTVVFNFQITKTLPIHDGLRDLDIRHWNTGHFAILSRDLQEDLKGQPNLVQIKATPAVIEASVERIHEDPLSFVQ